ncbi:MAG: response regulator [Bacteroidia bacterium]|nr:response regulator [Bacteroidia bacterium]
MPTKSILNILLADDDKDDRFFFEKALKALPFPTKLTTVADGEQLLNYISENSDKIPDVLFLDINMPRKNGAECLVEIKTDKRIKDFPVIIYSTSLNDTMADVLYEKGAHFYMRKCDFSELVKSLQRVFTLLEGKKFKRPVRDKFTLNFQEG